MGDHQGKQGQGRSGCGPDCSRKYLKNLFAKLIGRVHSGLSMITLELDQQANGQWRYRILQCFHKEQFVKVDWQWGPFSEMETIQQAKERFGRFDKILILDWI
jgi:hypothetical protein